jgi:hypothetical protein
MVPLTDHDELIATWRALIGEPGADGWRTIEVASAGPYRMRAGRHFPGNEEALLVGFKSIRRSAPVVLPQGQGFLVCWADLETQSDGCKWIALCREATANLELFAMMADDLRLTLKRLSNSDDAIGLQAFLSRIRAWQEFMRRGSSSLLSPEAEVGLFGELEILKQLIVGGMPGAYAVDAWKGPLDGLHDFVVGTGAIEVKSTASAMGFPAKIGSLAQLDDSLIRPLFLAGVRLSADDSGKTLSGKVEELRLLVSDDAASLNSFDARLLHAGFLDAHSESYTRRFKPAGIAVMLVSDDFPRLTTANVALAVRRAIYELDLDMIFTTHLDLADALTRLGATL